MKFRKNSLIASVVLSSMLAIASAQAHDPSLHAADAAAAAAEKPKPTTCAQLSDAKHYSTDTSDSDIKALKARCDAATKKARAAKPAPQAAGEKKN